MNKYSKIMILALVTVSLFLMVGNARAALIGINLGLPDIESDSPGHYTYDANTDIFNAWGYSVQITFDGTHWIPMSPRGTYNLEFKIDNNGNFAGVVPGDDLVITGNFTYNNTHYSGVLVAGEVINFGWQRLGSELLFDFNFDFTHGALAPFYAQYDDLGGNFSLNRQNNFTGDWSISHSGILVKSKTAPAVPEPKTLLLLGSGLLGLAFFAWRRRK